MTIFKKNKPLFITVSIILLVTILGIGFLIVMKKHDITTPNADTITSENKDATEEKSISIPEVVEPQPTSEVTEPSIIESS